MAALFRTRLWLGATLIVGAVLVGCGDDGGGDETASTEVTAQTETSETPEPEVDRGDVFVGTIPGASGVSSIAIVADDEQVTGFLCIPSGLGQWFETTPLGPDGTGELFVRRSAWGNVTIADDTATGQLLVPGGNPRDFSAAAARGDAGLYQAVRDNYEIGWIILSDGSQCGVTTHEGALETNSFPAPPLEPGAETIEISDPRQLELGVVKVTTPADIE